MGAAPSSSAAHERRAAAKWRQEARLAKVKARNRRVSAEDVADTHAKRTEPKKSEAQHDAVQQWHELSKHTQYNHTTAHESSNAHPSVRRNDTYTAANHGGTGLPHPHIVPTDNKAAQGGAVHRHEPKRISVAFSPNGDPTFSRRRLVSADRTTHTSKAADLSPEEMRAIHDILNDDDNHNDDDDAGMHHHSQYTRDTDRRHRSHRTAPHTNQAPTASRTPTITHHHQPSPSPQPNGGEEEVDDLDPDELAVIAEILGHTPRAAGAATGHAARLHAPPPQNDLDASAESSAFGGGGGGRGDETRHRNRRTQPQSAMTYRVQSGNHNDDDNNNTMSWTPSPSPSKGAGGHTGGGRRGNVPQRHRAEHRHGDRRRLDSVASNATFIVDNNPSSSLSPTAGRRRPSRFSPKDGHAIGEADGESESGDEDGDHTLHGNRSHPGVKVALDLITSASASNHEAWQAKIDGLRHLKTLVELEMGGVVPSLHAVVSAVCPEVTNPRALVAKRAVAVLGALCLAVEPSALDTVAADMVAALLDQAASGAPSFVTKPAEDALFDTTAGASPQRVVPPLAKGLRSKNGRATVLAATALEVVLDKSPPDGVPTFAAHVLPPLPLVLRRRVPTTREAGMHLLHALVGHAGWDDELLERHLKDDDATFVSQCAAGDDLAGARGSKSPVPRASPTHRPSGPPRKAPKQSSPRRGKATSTVQHAGKEWTVLVQLKTELEPTRGWQDRDAALGRLDVLLSKPDKYLRYAELIFGNMLIPLISDANGKLQLSALEVITKYIVIFKSELDARLLSLLIRKVAPVLSSASSMVCTAASILLDRIVAFCHTALLFKPWCAVVDREKSPKVQSIMLSKLRKLVAVGYARSCNAQIEKHVIPSACRWLGKSTSPKEVKRLCKVLFAEMEPQFLKAAESATPEAQRAVVQFMEKDLYDYDSDLYE
eukprot:m.203858 g.203858  ORF g.203858 m.203858 type:complete len:941 (+) comp22287_c0_seq1:77-2899(+)